MERRHPIVWVIGATRSSKSHLAKGLALGGRAGLNLHMISTSDYFRKRYAQPDTQSRKFVFDLSDFSAHCLAEDPDCNLDFLRKEIEKANQACVIEGERNPYEFSKLYEPDIDMVFFAERSDMETYDTTIEGSISIIEQSVRWSVKNGITPQNRVMKFNFGDERVKVSLFGKGYNEDTVVQDMHVGPKTPNTPYPWILPIIQMAGTTVVQNYGAHLQNSSSSFETARPKL